MFSKGPALWSDLHFLGYILNGEFQNDPVKYSNRRCQEFYERERQDGIIMRLQAELRPCPCSLAQALADRGRLRSDGTCTVGGNMQDRIKELCQLRNALQCFTEIIPS